MSELDRIYIDNLSSFIYSSNGYTTNNFDDAILCFDLTYSFKAFKSSNFFCIYFNKIIRLISNFWIYELYHL